jgi:hypothetical protein
MLSLRKNKDMFDIRFRSHFVENAVKKQVRQTTCTIAKVDETKHGKDRFNIVASGIAVQNSKDRDIKVHGQKVALAKAVACFPKEQRNDFWNVFEDSK